MINICFHGIGTPERELEPGEDAYWVSTDRFHRILDEVATWPHVRISLDDGNASDVHIGLPALMERGLRADFFVLAGRLNGAGSVDDGGVRELRKHGMTIGTHGMWHRSWRGMDQRQTHDELVAARERIAELSGAPVDLAACPLGAYDRRILHDLRRLGYSQVFTSDRRPARASAWLQPRYSVRRHDTVETLRAEVSAAPALPWRMTAAAKGLVKRWR